MDDDQVTKAKQDLEKWITEMITVIQKAREKVYKLDGVSCGSELRKSIEDCVVKFEIVLKALNTLKRAGDGKPDVAKVRLIISEGQTAMASFKQLESVADNMLGKPSKKRGAGSASTASTASTETGQEKKKRKVQ